MIKIKPKVNNNIHFHLEIVLDNKKFVLEFWFEYVYIKRILQYFPYSSVIQLNVRRGGGGGGISIPYPRHNPHPILTE